jgi:group I intron endonuclease
MYGIIYKAAGPSGKVYVGQTTQPLKRRKGKHKFRSLKMDVRTAFQRALLEHGFDAFAWEEIDEADTPEELDRKEREWIAHYRSNDPEHGYNMQNGGKVLCGEDNPFFGKRHTEEANKKNGEAHRGKTPFKGKRHTFESIQRMSEAHKGRKQSPETIQKRVEKLRGKKQPREAVLKTAEANRGRKRSSETRQRLSESHMGKPSPKKGIPSPKTRGNLNPNSVITEETARNIKIDIAGGMRNIDITKKYNIGKWIANSIRQQKAWAWVEI